LCVGGDKALSWVLPIVEIENRVPRTTATARINRSNGDSGGEKGFYTESEDGKFNNNCPT